MAETGRDVEIRALEVLIEALEPLDDEARTRVFDYTLRRLGMREMPSPTPPTVPVAISEPEVEQPRRASEVIDIRTLRAEKSPATANEMAAIVAYYLAEAAPAAERRQTVTTADVERLFKQAGFPLPSRIGNTLPNAAAAGYFDTAARGEYKLNPVGFNLVTQNLPRGSSQSAPRASRRTTATGGGRRKTTAAKKTATSRKKTGTPKRKRKE